MDFIINVSTGKHGESLSMDIVSDKLGVKSVSSATELNKTTAYYSFGDTTQTDWN